MTQFAWDNIISEDRRPGTAPDPVSCLTITDVAPGSPAGVVGIAKDDVLVSVNGQPAAECDINGPLLEQPEWTYVFFLPATEEHLVLNTTDIPVGLKSQKPMAALKELARNGELEPDEVAELWNLGHTEDVEELSTLAMTGGSFFKRLVGGDEDSPFLVLRGGTLIDLDRKDVGGPMVHRYCSELAQNWTSSFMAIGLYYLARTEPAEEALAMLNEAFGYYPWERIAAEIEQRTGNRPMPSTPWQGKACPDYDLRVLDGASPNGSLTIATAGLQPDQFLGVCLLATYRGNGPYSDFMRIYRRFGKPFHAVMSCLHVITMETEKRDDRPEWYRQESLARNEGIPFNILYDEGGAFTYAIEPPGSPHFLLIDHTGTIVFEGWLDDRALWRVIGQQA